MYTARHPRVQSSGPEIDPEDPARDVEAEEGDDVRDAEGEQRREEEGRACEEGERGEAEVEAVGVLGEAAGRVSGWVSLLGAEGKGRRRTGVEKGGKEGETRRTPRGTACSRPRGRPSCPAG